MLVSAAVAVVMLAGCSGDDSSTPDETPEDRLAAAKANFDEAEFVAFKLATDALPSEVDDGLLEAEGTGTHDPAFDGQVKVHTTLDFTADVVAVDGTVYAELPFAGWSELNPEDYGAPDPAELMATDGGISSLFTATEDVTEGETQRDGSVVLTSIEGTLPADAVKSVFPSAGADDFDVTYSLTDDDMPASVTITGPFYGDAGAVTYTIDLNLDADEVTIEAPI